MGENQQLHEVEANISSTELDCDLWDPWMNDVLYCEVRVVTNDKASLPMLLTVRWGVYCVNSNPVLVHWKGLLMAPVASSFRFVSGGGKRGVRTGTYKN